MQLANLLLVFISVPSLNFWLGSIADAADTPSYTLGFLSSSPDSAITESLAIEWQSAFQVAMDLLNSRSESFQLKAAVESCSCELQSAQNAAEQLVKKHGDLIGVVGPACSEASMSAAKVFQARGIPLISFAATAARLSDRNMYSNFLRTVYSDEHQAAAVVATVNQLQMTNITVVYTNDAYSLPLAQRIRSLSGENVFRMQLLELGANASINTRELEGMFNSIEPYSFVVLAVQPAVAQKLWELVVQLGKSTFPWWYMGTDGVTAVDASTTQGSTLQGEVGLAPYGGDPSDDLVCEKFYQHWGAVGYPGLSNRSISYAPYLFDTVQTYFNAAEQLHQAGLPVNGSTLLPALASANHKGCTGSVLFDPKTGSRISSSAASGQSSAYDFVSYKGKTWQLKGRIVDGNFSILQPLQRPGTVPADEEVFVERGSGKEHSRVNKALVAAIAVFSSAFIVVSITFICYHRLRQNNPMAFLRMNRQQQQQCS